jgi:hypothetical protein
VRVVDMNLDLGPLARRSESVEFAAVGDRDPAGGDPGRRHVLATREHFRRGQRGGVGGGVGA